MEKLDENLIPVRVQILDTKEGEFFYFINQNNKEVFKIKGSLLGHNMLANKDLIGLCKFDYFRNLIFFDSADFSDNREILNLRLFVIDFKGNIILDLKGYYSTQKVFNKLIYLLKEKPRSICFLKDDLSIVELPYSKFESKLLNGYLVSRKNENGEKLYGIVDKDFEIIYEYLHEEELDLRKLLHCVI